jgi:hypothetical protein
VTKLKKMISENGFDLHDVVLPHVGEVTVAIAGVKPALKRINQF